MDPEYIRLSKYSDGSYRITDIYPDNKGFYRYNNSYNYYDIDVDKIIVCKNSDNEYFIRYHDVNKMNYVPFLLKVKNFCCEIDKLKNNITLMLIQGYDKDLFKKCREIWNKIIGLIVINNANNFVMNTIDDDAKEFIMVDVHKNTSFVEGNYRGELIIVLCSVIDSYVKTSLVQVKIHKYA